MFYPSRQHRYPRSHRPLLRSFHQHRDRAEGARHAPRRRAHVRLRFRVANTVRWEGWQLGFPNFHVSFDRSVRSAILLPRTACSKGVFSDLRARSPVSRGGWRRVASKTSLRFTMPFGFPGRAVGQIVLVPHIKRLLRETLRHAQGDWPKLKPGASTNAVNGACDCSGVAARTAKSLPGCTTHSVVR